MKIYCRKPSVLLFALACFSLANPALSEASTPEACDVKVRISSEKKFKGWLWGGHGSGPSTLKKVQRFFVLILPTRKTYITVSFNSSRANKVHDHRTGEKYEEITHNFKGPSGGLFANHDYLLTLQKPMWRTEPRSIRFSCPNAKGEYKFTLPPLKHTGISSEG